MDNHKIEAVIFDLGNVLIDFDYYRAAERAAKFCPKNPNEIFNLFFDSEITGLFEEGKILPLEFFLKVKEMLNLKLDYKRFLPIWNEIFFLSGKNQAVYNLTKILKGHYKLVLLSNTNVLHFDYLKKNFPVFDTFHYIITSYEVGLRKPHPLIYKKTLDILGVSCGFNVFYVDDRPELVNAAKRLGLKSFVFKDVLQLRRDLENTGIKIN
jgi:putative hydrolase of the HAD superfamily